jgi:hypothetical protein
VISTTQIVAFDATHTEGREAVRATIQQAHDCLTSGAIEDQRVVGDGPRQGSILV